MTEYLVESSHSIGAEWGYHGLALPPRGRREQGPESDLDALRAGRIAVTPVRWQLPMRRSMRQ
jgi:hypothetical protein